LWWSHVNRRLKNIALVAVGFALALGLRASGAVDVIPAAAQVVPAAQSVSPGGRRQGLDPLGDDEIKRALAISRAGRGLTVGLPGVAKLEVLQVQRHQETKADMLRGSWPRRADVLVYAYGADVLARGVVNLDSGSLDEITLERGAQLPPTAVEAAAALQLLLADATTGPRLRDHIRPLRPEQLSVRAAVYRADSQPDRVPPGAASCGAHRCVQLLLAGPDGAPQPYIPIVNLSAGRAVTLAP
jgi:hypothetical protein